MVVGCSTKPGELSFWERSVADIWAENKVTQGIINIHRSVYRSIDTHKHIIETFNFKYIDSCIVTYVDR